MSNKRVLLISYYFPPDTEVGGIRITKYVKYLPDFGWEPHVLTIKEKYIKMKDRNRLKDVEKSKIHRASVWLNFSEIVLKFRDLILFRTVKKNYTNSPKTTNNSHSFKGRDKDKKGIAFLMKRILTSTFEFPDKMVGWLIPAVWKGYWVIKKEKIVVILATSPPQTVSIVGLILSKLTKAKLITDYRDPWYFHIGDQPRARRTTLTDKIERWLERKIASNSEKVIAVTQQYTDLLRLRHHDMSTDKFCTISNGFDSEDFQSKNEFNNKPDEFIMTYLGTFYHGRTPKELLIALSELYKENIIPFDKLKINFIGDVRYANGVSVEGLIEKSNLKDYVNVYDKIPYKESLAQMQRSVILILFAPDQYYMIPAKTYEYIFAKRYILCFSQDGATADLIRMKKVGIVVDPHNIREIKDAIKRFYLQWEKGVKPKQDFDANVFERRELTKNLSRLLDEVNDMYSQKK